ncbi:MAG: phosphatidate cytidylyltransferase [Pseudomonadota bacterium]
MLIARIISAVIAVIVILLLLFVMPAAYLSYVVAVVFLGAGWEWSALARMHRAPIRLAFALGVVALCLLVNITLTDTLFRAVLIAAGLWWLAAFVLVIRYPLRVPAALVALGAPLTLVPAYIGITALARFPVHELYAGSGLLLFVLVVIWGADVGGYFAGRFLGKRKLAVKVSPNKTWAGVFGGLALSAVIGGVGSVLFDFPATRLVPLCIATGAISVLGDLLISLFKREAGLKDSGVLFPGHGGLLDRLDSISAGLPLFVAGVAIGHGPW